MAFLRGCRSCSISFAPPGDFDTAIGRLVEQLGTDVDWVRQHTELADDARKWKAADRKKASDFLLRGATLQSAQSWLDTRPPTAPDPTAEQLELIAASQRASGLRRRNWTIGAIAVAAAAIVFAGFAYWQRGVALARRDQALSTQSLFLADLSGQEAKAGRCDERHPACVGRTAQGHGQARSTLRRRGGSRPYIRQR